MDAFQAVQVESPLFLTASDGEVVAEKVDGLGRFHDLRLTVADAELVLPDFQVGWLGEDGAEGGFLPYSPGHVVVAHDEDHSSRLLFDDGKKFLDLLRVKVFQLGVEFDLDVIGEISGVDDPVRLEPSQKAPQIAIAAARCVCEVDDQSLPGRPLRGDAEKMFEKGRLQPLALLSGSRCL